MRGLKLVIRPRLQLKVNLAFGSAELSSEAMGVLENLAMALENPSLEEDRFVLAGHTDAVVLGESYDKLPQERAASLSDFLVERGVAPERLQAVGCGEKVLLRPEDPDAGLNRRVEIANAGR